MNQKRMILIHLHHMESMTRKILRRILIHDYLWKGIYTYSITELQEHLQINGKRAQSIYQSIHTNEAYEQMQATMKEFSVLTILDAHYPQSLKNIPDPPLVLYARGQINCLRQNKMISMIGTRLPSVNAQAKVTHIIPKLVENDWIIVSGLALGIDSMAHRTTIRYRGTTIGILGGGFHHIYPKQHTYLIEQISKKGLVLSEYPPFMRPQKYHFPERNRIISGLSLATMVIEAKERSGSMITVDQALEQGREVYAMPGDPLIEQTTGCHRLIQEGAKLIIHPEDILTDWAHITDNED